MPHIRRFAHLVRPWNPHLLRFSPRHLPTIGAPFVSLARASPCGHPRCCLIDGAGESPVAVAAIAVGRGANKSAEDEDNEDGYIELEAEEDVAVKVPLLTVTSNSPARPAGRVKVGPQYAAGSPPGQAGIPLADLTGSDMSQKRDLLLAARRGSDNLTIVPKRVSP